MNKYNKNAEEFQKALAQVKETGEPVIMTVQKNRNSTSGFIPTQLDIMDSMEKIKNSDFIVSITRSKTPSLFKKYFEQFKAYFKQIFYSLFKNK